MAKHPKYHPLFADPRMGGTTCEEMGHKPELCDDGIEYPKRPIVFTAECLECKQDEPMTYVDRNLRDDEVFRHVERTGHRVAIGWAER